MRHPAYPRILHVISHLDMGGAENVAISLAEELYAEFNFSFFAVGGIADNPVGQAMARRLERLAIPVHSGTALDFKKGGAVQAGLKLRQLIWRTRPEVVHLHTEIPETIFAVASVLGLPRDLQVLRTVHNSKLWPAWGAIGRMVEGRLRAAQAMSVGVSAACLQGLWEFQAAHRLPLTPKAMTQVVYNGVLTGDPRGPIERTLSADRPVRVLFAGRLEPQKGVDLLPDLLTATSALTTCPVEVTLLGRGALEGSLRQWISTHTLPWTVTLAEPVASLAEHLHEYDVMLVPSRFEGLCLVAIEALMAGMPVVATRVRGLSEIFPAGYPLLCDSEDVPGLARTLADAVEDHAHYADVVATYHAEIVERFGVARMAQEYRRVYLAALQPTALEPIE
ncbi:glycosyltransferase family 4 protein [Deinococcus sp. D7000]|nr:glycosyltransferase family 4 protein [Deinococcus sp. D7000]